VPEQKLKISVAMINYNYGRYIRAAVDSVLAQTRAVDELVVVDDGSKDDSLAALDGVPGPVKIISQANAGAASASTRAISECSGDVVLLLDSDDLMGPRRAELVEAAYTAHPTAQWVWHRMDLVDRVTMEPLGPGPVLKGYTAGLHDHRADVAHGKLPLSAPATSALSFRRSFVEKLLPIPSHMHVHDNYLKLASLGLAEGVVLQEVLSLMGIHNSNMTTGLDRDRTTAIRSNSAVDQAMAFRPLGLTRLADRLLGEAVVRSGGGRRLSPDRRRRVLQVLGEGGPRQWAITTAAVGVAVARTSRERVLERVSRG